MPAYTIADLRRDIAGLSDDTPVTVYANISGETIELADIDGEASGTATDDFFTLFASVQHAS